MTSLDVPDAITGEQHKLRLAIDGLDAHVGEVGNGLVLSLQLRITLVFEVAKSSGEGKHAVDAAIFNEAA